MVLPRTYKTKMRRYFRNSPFIPFVVVGLVVLAVIYYGVSNLTAGSTGAKSSLLSGDERIDVKKAKATQALNKEFSFPLKDQEGKEVSKLKFTILNAELKDEIIVKGERGTAVRGRTFLILNLKIENSFNQALQINARDYMRLSVNNSKEKIAPEIHNDPVEVQAISTKYTRVGFPINDTDENLTIQVGEINGKKETIKLNFEK